MFIYNHKLIFNVNDSFTISKLLLMREKKSLNEENITNYLMVYNSFIHFTYRKDCVYSTYIDVEFNVDETLFACINCLIESKSYNFFN